MRLEDLIRTVRVSIAQITHAPENGSPPIGTGFLVGEGRHLITAQHVVDAMPPGTALFAGLAGVDHEDDDVVLRAAFIYVPLRLISVDPRNDVALLELMMPPDAVSVELTVENVETGVEYTSGRTAPMKLSTTRVREGLDVAASGFPLFAPSLVTTRGIVASTFAPQGFGDDDPIAFLCDITAISGNSGGPVYRTADGAVIGICQAVKVADVGGGFHSVPLTVITPIQHAIELMKEAGVGHDVSRPKSPARSNSNRQKKRR